MSLIQDALKKVQNERNKIRNSIEPEDHKASSNVGNINTIESKKKKYIILGTVLLLISIIYITATFLLKKPVKINKNNFLKKNMIVKTQKKNDNPQNKLIIKAKSIQKAKDRSINKIYIKKKPEKTQDIIKRKKSVFPVFKQKIQLVPIKKKKKEKKKKNEILSRLEELTIKGEKLYKQKKYIEAVSYFKEALKIKKNKDLYLNIYKCYKKTNNLVLLKAYTIDALEHYKDDVFLNKVLGILLFREKDYLKALPYFELILQKMNRNVEILTYKGLCLFHLKRFEDSLEIFKNILRLNNNKIESYYYIGLIYDNIKDYKTALDHYKIFEQLFDQQREVYKNFRHRNWIIKRISLLERSMKIK